MLVSARRFPGIDAAKLDGMTAPGPVEIAPRRLTATEFLEQSEPLEQSERLGQAERPDRPNRLNQEELLDRVDADRPGAALSDPKEVITADLGEVRTRIAGRSD